MRCLLQRVSHASVTVDGEVIGKIGHGFLVLFCAMQGDTPEQVVKLAAKISKIRVFSDEDGRMNKSIMDVGGSCLIVSQFTLAADTSRGNRPGFSAAAAPEDGQMMYAQFCKEVSALGLSVQTGQFGASMQVNLLNDGPATFWIDI